MNVRILIDAIVRQTTVLIAQLATSGGIRAPLAHIAGQVFLSLARELDNQGVGRKVSADMFGMALRTYQRKVQRLSESATEQGRSLWEAVFEYVQSSRATVSHGKILNRFRYDDEAQVKSVLRDLVDHGMLFSSGRGYATVYRAATRQELCDMRDQSDLEALELLVWTVIFNDAPIDRETLEQRCAIDSDKLDQVLQRLISSKRISVSESAKGPEYRSAELVIAADNSVGWEASILDHFHAMVRTVCAKLQEESRQTEHNTIGGSTYTFTVWPGHPLKEEVFSELTNYRERQSELRTRVDDYNRQHGVPDKYIALVSYAGQYWQYEGDGAVNTKDKIDDA
jgi:hypothetical protein